jgi:hypothetical protein
MNPETERFGTRKRTVFRTWAMVIAVVGSLWPYLFSIAANVHTTFSLANRTRYYLHAIVNNETFVYVSPGATIEVDVKAPSSVSARVRYSPGQTVRGTGERTIDIQTTTTSTEGTQTCHSSDSHGETCSGTEPTSTTTTNPARWDVLPTDLSAE